MENEQEFQELENLEKEGTLDVVQKARLEELRQADVPAEKTKETETALAQKEHWRKKAEKAEAERKALEDQLKNAGKGKTLDIEDYIDISASLEGLDQREKERLAREHKLTGKPLAEIRKDEDFQLWQEAYRKKVEKEVGLKPSSVQDEKDRPMSLSQQINTETDMAKKEEILKKFGLYRDVRPRSDHKSIGR